LSAGILNINDCRSAVSWLKFCLYLSSAILLFFCFFGEVMKVISKLLVPALLAGLFLSACGEKEVEAPVAEAPAGSAPAATEAAPAEAPVPAAIEPGGYVPTPEELIPGETRPVETAPAETAPAAEAPAEAK
jgi:hypothetical protein